MLLFFLSLSEPPDSFSSEGVSPPSLSEPLLGSDGSGVLGPFSEDGWFPLPGVLAFSEGGSPDFVAGASGYSGYEGYGGAP